LSRVLLLGASHVTVDSQNSVPVSVEQSTYWNAEGVVWAAGTNVVGTPLP